jgi:hypothetical protein
MSLLTKICKDLYRVKVYIPGRKLKAADRFSEQPDCVHERLKTCVHEVAVPKFGYNTNNKEANSRSLTDATLWKSHFPVF